MMHAALINPRLQHLIVRMMRAPRWVWVAFAVPVALLLLMLLLAGAVVALLFLLITAPLRAFRRLSPPAGSSISAHRENVRIAVTSARVIDP